MKLAEVVVALCAVGCGHEAATPVDAPPGQADGAPDGVPLDASLDASPDAGPAPNLHSLQFDGLDDLIDVPAAASLSTLSAVTLEAWVKPAASTTERAILGKNLTGPSAQYALVRQSDGQARVAVSNTNSGCIASAGSAVFTANKWTHVAGTWAGPGGSPRLYLDGVLVSTSGCSGAMGSVLGDLLIGAIIENGNVTKQFAGTIDEVRIWNKARSQPEIQAAMNHTLIGNEPGLVGYWNFENVAGGQALDASASGNHGRLGTTAGADAADPTPSSDVPF